ncbi:MAG: VWA domain-containing protein [Lewinellaceae bacterium]|nr:VWA domain-containing protein [Lewinellaceae bacterium]
MKNLIYLLFAVPLFLFLACDRCKDVVCLKHETCEKGKCKTKDNVFELHIDFWNPTGSDPEISFDAKNSSPEIKIDFSQSFEGIALPPNLTNVIIDNVRIIDNNNVNYEIERITAYEFRDDINDWKEDVEFIMEFAPIEDLDVMLILDASASLGQDFNRVKEFANDFINRIFAESSSSEIGVVDFSDVINFTPLTNNQSTLNSYVSNIQQGPFTTLYEAMDIGIDELQNNQAEGKAILTFTDGTDNNSAPQFTPSFLTDKIINDPNNIKINSFTIGFEGNGGVDKPVLENLAANGGVAEFPKTIGELETVFEKFSKSISNVYNLTYIRNQQIIPQNDAARLRFVFETKPK